MPDSGNPVILPRPDLTLHKAPPRPAPPHIHSTLGWVFEGRSHTLGRVGVYCTVPHPHPAHQADAHVPPNMSARRRPSTRASDFRYSSTWSRASRSNSTRSWDSRNSLGRSRDSRFNSVRSRRSSLRDSIRSVASSAWQETARRGEPLRRVAEPHVRSARVWAGNVKKRVSSGGAVPLLTPDRDHHPAVVVEQGNPSPGPARNSHRVHATVWASSVAHTLRWETTSGLTALVECGAAAGSAVVTGAGRLCSSVSAMADTRLQQLRRSISSWSLSTVKKPKVTLPKLKKPKLKFFSGGRKSRVDPKGETAAVEEVKAALLKAEGDEGGTAGAGKQEMKEKRAGGGEVIHEPTTSGKQDSETQPTIVLTVHHRNTPPEPLPPPLPSPGLLAANNNDLEFIDSDDPDAEEDGVVEAISPEVEYSDQWFDARGTLTRSKNDMASAINDYVDVRATRYYDADDEVARSSNGDSLATKSNYVGSKEGRGSVKAREWVKSYEENTETRVERYMRMQKEKNPSSLPKSNSEIRLDDIEDPSEKKWSRRDEIKLNTAGGSDGMDKCCTKNLSQEHKSEVKMQESEQQGKETEKKKMTHKESIKNIFQIRGKLSIKPIVDSQQPKYTDTDIYIASTPYALANIPVTIHASNITDSLDVSDDGINCSSFDFDPALEISLTTQNEAQNESQQHNLPTTSSGMQTNLEVKQILQDNVNPTPSVPEVMVDSADVNERESKIPEEVKVEEASGHDQATAKLENVRKMMMITGAEEKSASEDKKPTAKEVTATKEDDEQELMKEPETVSKENIEEKEKIEIVMDESTALPSEDIVASSTLQPVSKTQTEMTKPITKDHISLSQRTDRESPSDPSKPEAKKKKISGASIPKSIKNFAGSIFSQQTSGIGKKEGGEEKKKKGRMSPFTKDHLFKNSSKMKAEEITTEEKKRAEGEVTKPLPKIKIYNINQSTDKETEFITDAAVTDIPDQGTATEALDCNDTNNEGISELLPTSRESPESLVFISPIESDEQKSISHESSPELNTSFVEENGLRLRKDALQAIKAMENDETGTHYYSFLTASEYHTPLRVDDHKSKQAITAPQDSLAEPVSPHPAKPSSEEGIQEPNQESKARKDIGREEKGREKVIPNRFTPVVSQAEILLLVRNKLFHEELQNIVENNKNNEIENLQTPPANISSHSQVNVAKSEPPLISPSDKVSSPGLNSPSACDTVPPEVPKLKLAPTLSVQSEELPKPSPRVKKGRYGYSTGSRAPKALSNPPPSISKVRNSTVNTENVIVNGSTSSEKAVDSSMPATFPRRHAQSKKKEPLMERVRISHDSGYAGPNSSPYYYSNNSNTNNDSEPIYWEISETKGAPPRPSPRTKKGQKISSEPLLNQTPPPSNGGDTSPDPSSTTESKPVPEWLSKRAPIPSPRSRKQRSLQSLPTMVPAEDSMEVVKKKLQLPTQKPRNDTRQQGPARIKAAAGEQFYSGKAASISYGFTPTCQTTATTTLIPPSPPLRGRKASQMSLPGSMMAEEMLNKKQNRRSMQEDHASLSTRRGPPHRPQSMNRARRRTDPMQGMTIHTIKSAVQRVGKSAVGLTELLVAVGLQHEASVIKSEELLTDVLYAVQSLMGGAGGGMWAVGGVGASQTSSPGTCVTLDQVKQVLQAAFQVTHDTMDRISQDVRSRPLPEVNLHLSLKEAKDLRRKTVKGTTNSYVTVTLPSTGQSHRTRLEKDTLNPKWNQEFSLPLKNLQKDVVNLEVWHEHDAVKVKQLTAVRDFHGLGRLVKGTTAKAQNQPAHLLGQINLNVKDVSQCGVVDEWYTLEKRRTEEEPSRGGGDFSRGKERGTMHLLASVSSTSAQLETKDGHSYDSLLARLIHHQLAATDNNNEESDWSRPWSGQVSGAAVAALSQYAITLDLTDSDVQLSWWCIGSQVSTVDPAWILSQLHKVQAALGKGAYKGDSLGELQTSLATFVQNSEKKLKDLHAAFPPASGVVALHNLKYTLKTLQAMQSHIATRGLLDQEDFPHLQEVVSNSLTCHTKSWWNRVIEEQLRGVKTADEQITRVVNIVAEALTFLTHIADFYSPTFMKEMNIAYMQTAYLFVSNKINPCVRPLVINIYNRMPTRVAEITEETDDANYALDVGTSLWQLYRNLGRLHTLGVCLPPELKAESGVREYHRWFSRGVMRWLELAVSRAQIMIIKAVELDNLEPVDSYCNFSSSATDTTGIFLDVKNWWVKLAWPDPENGAVLLTKILEDVCSCCTKYSDLLREKVQSMFHQESFNRVFITKQICVGLNNIERVREELTALPVHFGFEELLEEVRKGEHGCGAMAAKQLEATVERLIFSAAENMEAKVNEFVETVIDKMRATLESAVSDACESQSPNPLLGQTLDPTLDLLQTHLNSSNFHRFLCRTWEVTLETFHANVKRNAERRKANYFGGVYNILDATLNFFSPSDGNGLDRNTAQTAEYTSLLELLESLKMTTEALIAKYYRERYEEQVDEILPSKAQLVVKMLFTRSGKLIVEVIMARDMVVEGDTGSINSSHRGLQHLHYHEPVDSYVKIQAVPAEWFPIVPIRKTKTLRKQDPAVYEENFEYEMSQNDDGVSGGFLLLTLKDYNLGRTNTFIGEAVVPFTSLKCVDSSQIHTVANTYLKMTTPGLDIGYKSLRALHFRTGDRTATSFLKKVSKRLLDSKNKTSSPLKPEDEKPRSKSPNIRERLKFS